MSTELRIELAGCRQNKGMCFVFILAAILCAILVSTGSTALAEENVQEVIRNTRALREKLLKDPYLPGYHFVTPE